MSTMQIIGGLMLAVPAGLALLNAFRCGALRETLFIITLTLAGTAWILGAFFLIGIRP